MLVIRPSYIAVGGLIFYRDSFFFFFLLFWQPDATAFSELAERNLTTIGHMLGNKCNLKTHVRNLGYPLPTNWGPKNHLFGPTSQLYVAPYSDSIRNGIGLACRSDLKPQKMFCWKCCRVGRP